MPHKSTVIPPVTAVACRLSPLNWRHPEFESKMQSYLPVTQLYKDTQWFRLVTREATQC